MATTLANLLSWRKKVRLLPPEEVERLAQNLMPAWSPLQRLFMKQVCRGWRKVFEDEQQHRLQYELGRYKRMADDMLDPMTPLLIRQHLCSRQAAWMRTAVLSAFHCIRMDFENQLRPEKFSSIGIVCIDEDTKQEITEQALVLPRNKFAYTLWAQCGMRPGDDQNVPQVWNAVTIMVPKEYYRVWQQKQVESFSSTILPWIMGLQMYLPLYPKAQAELSRIEAMSPTLLLKHIKQEERRRKYDRDLCNYLEASLLLLEQHQQESLIPESVRSYMILWFVWRDIENAISLLEMKRTKDQLMNLSLHTARMDRFQSNPCDVVRNPEDEDGQRRSWWSVVPRLMCFAASAPAYSSPPQHDTDTMAYPVGPPAMPQGMAKMAVAKKLALATPPPPPSTATLSPPPSQLPPPGP